MCSIRDRTQDFASALPAMPLVPETWSTKSSLSALAVGGSRTTHTP
jgi:hypothetical protein